MAELPAELVRRWRLDHVRFVSSRSSTTWFAESRGEPFVVKHHGPGSGDWRYPLRVTAALEGQGWPVPRLAAEPVETDGGGAWVLLHRLPGEPFDPAVAGTPREQRRRGRLLAEFHVA